MLVIFPAADVVDESYLALVAQEQANPTGANHLEPLEQTDDSDVDISFTDDYNAPEIGVDSHQRSYKHLLGQRDKRRRLQERLMLHMNNGATAASGAAGAKGVTFSLGTVTKDVKRLRDLFHPSINEAVKQQQQATFRLVKTVSDFSHDLSKIEEQHADDLHNLIENYKRKTLELVNDRPQGGSNDTLLNAWESMMQEVEADCQAHSDIAGILSRSVSRPLLEKTFHMKIQSRKVFTHRESFETILEKTEEMLNKCHSDYCIALEVHLSQNSQNSLADLINAHNTYVQQLHAANGMIEHYYKETLPNLLQELDDVSANVSGVVAETLIQGSDAISLKLSEMTRRYDGLGKLCKQINAESDINEFAKTLNIPETFHMNRHVFAPPNAIGDLGQHQMHQLNLPPLRDEVIFERSSQGHLRSRMDALRMEAQDLEMQMRQINDALETLYRMHARSLDSQLYNKANEIQEDISLKRFDLKVADIHLAAVKAQREMFSSTMDGETRGAKGSASSSSSSASALTPATTASSSSPTLAAGAGMKNKWVKAFKSIKGKDGSSGGPSSGLMAMAQVVEGVRQRNGGKDLSTLTEGNHVFQEYTYKKITPCDVCSQILRGHTRQGLKCKLCRMNVHPHCQEQVPKCQPKSRLLLRRQKSASELDSSASMASGAHRLFGGQQQQQGDEQEDERYQDEPSTSSFHTVSRSSATSLAGAAVTPPTAGSPSQTPIATPGGGLAAQTQSRHLTPEHYTAGGAYWNRGGRGGSNYPGMNSLNVAGTHPSIASSSAPHSPTSGSTGSRRHPPRLNLRMKSVSLDSPDVMAAGPGKPTGVSSLSHSTERRRHQGYLTSSAPRLQQQQQQSRSGHSSHSQSTKVPGLLAVTKLAMMARHHRSAKTAMSAPANVTDLPTNERCDQLALGNLSQTTPSSPVHNRRLLSGGSRQHMMAVGSGAPAPAAGPQPPVIKPPSSGLTPRMSSIELPDENEKSISSSSTSPCPSSPHRLPHGVFVVLYNYKPRQMDELELKAGTLLTVLDPSDKDWWKGTYRPSPGSAVPVGVPAVGYFPSTYVLRLGPGERPLQVTQPLQIPSTSPHDPSPITLLRDQIVIQIGDDGSRDPSSILIRTAENKQGICPINFLSEVI